MKLLKGRFVLGSNKTVLVSGASGLVGYGILRSLKGEGYKLIGTTIYDKSPADCFSDIVEIAPKTSDVTYIDWLINTVKKHQIDLIIPSIEADMIKWNECREVLAKAGAVLMLNNSELIDLCVDKWLFYQKLHQFAPSYAIESRLSGDFETLSKDFKVPFLLKPKRGFASQGIVKVDNLETFEQHKEKLNTTHMAQPIIGDNEHEYTVSAFFDSQSQMLCYQQLKRKLSKEGFTELAESVEIEGIEKVLTDLANIFKPIGPTNFQFRYEGKQIKLLEINPRISSATSIRKALGYNESKMCVEYFLENKVPELPTLKQGKAIRYIEDYLI